MHGKDPSSPVETPTTPTQTTPVFPSLPSLTTTFNYIACDNAHLSAVSPNSTVANRATRRRNSSIISIPSSPLQSTISRPLPIRPAKMANSNGGRENGAPLYNPLRLHTDIPSTSNTHSPASKSRNRAKSSRSPPPKYHVTVIPNSRQERQSRRRRGSLKTHQRQHHTPAWASAINHLTTPLVPLISVTSGQPHPESPLSLLQYHLLTHRQLDDLARFYHQVRPACDATWRYPAAIEPWVASDGIGGENVALDTKRRRWGRFIGLRGCESPVDVDGVGVEDVVEKMEREWKRVLERREEDERMREKGWRGRW